MKHIVSLVLALILAGCAETCPKNKFTEGTSLVLGLYIPYNGTVYGIQAVNYLSGRRIEIATNSSFNVHSKHSVSNETFNCFNLNELSDVTIGERDL